MSAVEAMRQTAPFPQPLAELVGALRYKPGWQFDLVDIDRGQGSQGLTFQVLTLTQDGYHPERERRVMHYFIVPAAAYDRRAWQRWLLDQLLLVEQHETCEFFRFEHETPNGIRLVEGPDSIDTVRPYAPNHGPGRDPYVAHELGTDLDARTSFRGQVKQ